MLRGGESTGMGIANKRKRNNIITLVSIYLDSLYAKLNARQAPEKTMPAKANMANRAVTER